MNVPRHGNRRTLPPEEKEFLLARNAAANPSGFTQKQQQHGEEDHFLHQIENAVKVPEVS